MATEVGPPKARDGSSKRDRGVCWHSEATTTTAASGNGGSSAWASFAGSERSEARRWDWVAAAALWKSSHISRRWLGVRCLVNTPYSGADGCSASSQRSARSDRRPVGVVLAGDDWQDGSRSGWGGEEQSSSVGHGSASRHRWRWWSAAAGRSSSTEQRTEESGGSLDGGLRLEGVLSLCS